MNSPIIIMKTRLRVMMPSENTVLGNIDRCLESTSDIINFLGFRRHRSPPRSYHHLAPRPLLGVVLSRLSLASTAGFYSPVGLTSPCDLPGAHNVDSRSETICDANRPPPLVSPSPQIPPPSAQCPSASSLCYRLVWLRSSRRFDGYTSLSLSPALAINASFVHTLLCRCSLMLLSGFCTGIDCGLTASLTEFLILTNGHWKDDSLHRRDCAAKSHTKLNLSLRTLAAWPSHQPT
ncbi:hypothetical protein R3P38DRAFT_3179709 [Favolaschia claudopus]|uniref:Uncharacterized protein n=1 Tax=Favolaschia claudopus TaxID=2862362 RepID=A0AAW0CQ38_9AGAR